jgi:hypothetical protein
LSPQSRRGRAATGSHRRSPSHVPVEPGKAPAALPEETVEEEEPLVATPAPRALRRRGAARVSRSSGWRNVLRYTRAYVPLFVAFLGLFAVVWIYRSFVNPPPQEPPQVWTRIEAKYSPQIDSARLKIDNPKSDFATRIAGFTELRDAIKGWMSELTPITDWTVGATSSAEYAAASTAGQDMVSLIQYGNQEVADLDQVVAAKSEADIAAVSQSLSVDDTSFQQTWIQVRKDFGLAVPSAQATLALPSPPSPSASAGASGSPGPSAGPAASATPGGSPAAVPSATTGPSPSAGPTASPQASPTAKAS